MNEDGWIWMVFGRTLFLWSYKSTSDFLTCYTLSLSPSGLKYTAEAVTVIGGNAEGKISPPGVVAVSPEGVVRHWTKATSANQFTETTVDLHGQVARALVQLSVRVR